MFRIAVQISFYWFRVNSSMNSPIIPEHNPNNPQPFDQKSYSF